MIDLDKIEASVNHLIRLYPKDTRATQSLGEVNEVITLLRKAEKDAARYRWLRESASTEDHGGLAYDFRLVDAIRYMPGATPNETMDIDDAIDEAMQCK
jgi:hypothetical protein